MTLRAATRIRIPFDYPLGDLVVFGGAIRELQRCHPGQFDLTVESSVTEYWDRCPHVRVEPPGSAAMAGSEELVVRDLYAEALRQANHRPRHLLQALVDELNRQLGTQIEVAEFRGETWFRPEDAASPGPVELALGSPVPYWIVCNGGKFDRTVKWWPEAGYRKVVGSFRNRLLFVQVGRSGDYHPRLEGTLDFRGGTDLATLLRLIHWSEGVLCPITSLMHLAAAVPRPAGVTGLRPCVVLGGGIEPPHLTAYPGHRFLSTVGALPCTGSGCWKARTVTLGDGDPGDAPDARCENVVNLHPRCMELIRPAEVTRAISTFVEGGARRTLSLAEAATARAGLGLIRGFALDDTRFTRQTARLAIERQAKLVRTRSLPGRGQGIVTLASGLDYVASAWVLVGLLRLLGCRLPVEVWLMGHREWLAPLRRAFARWGAKVRFLAHRVDPRRPRCSLFAAKPEVITASAFQEVLWIDADSFPRRDPAYLFTLPEYRDTGAVFWPDLAGYHSTAPEAWRMFGLAEDRESPEVQGGEFLVNKARVAPPLLLSRWCNRHYPHLYSVVNGEKDVFRLAFRKLGQPFAMPTRCPDLVDGCLFNTDFSAQGLFQHRVSAKIRVGHPLRPVTGFTHHERCQELLDAFTSQIAPQLRSEPSAPTPGRTIPVEVRSE